MQTLSKDVRYPVAALLVAFACVPGGDSRAQTTPATYRITVYPDDVSKGDLAMVADTAVSAAEGSDLPRAARRLAAGAAGEIGILVRDRIDTGALTLDDGGVVVLADGDLIEAEPGCKEGDPTCALQPGATITFGCKEGGCQPVSIRVVSGNGCVRQILMRDTPPTIVTECPIVK